MFKNKIPEWSKRRGIQNAFQLANELKISQATASRLWSGNFSKVGIDTLHKLCELFDCQIGDFLFFDGQSLDV